jgi:hypothetical protein
MEYTILKANDEEYLTKMVNEYIAKGWVPQGGVSMVVSHYSHYIQAMIKISK